ncbi:hypothetical protein GCM10009612_10130 [Streptomyces beijiangensis]
MRVRGPDGRCPAQPAEARGAVRGRRRGGVALSTMLVGGVADGFDLAEVGRMFSRITEAHTKRMAALGLAA